MNRIRLVAIGAILMAVLPLVAQQTTTTARPDAGKLPTLDEQMTLLTSKLDLTHDQQSKIRPIMQELHDYTEKIMQEDNLTRDEKLAKVRPRRMEASKRLRELLTDEQQKKLDAYLAGPHGEMHGSLSGGATQQSPK